MKNLRYTYLIQKFRNDEQDELNEMLISWIRKQANVNFIVLNVDKIRERNPYQIAAILNSKDDLEKAKNKLDERNKKHFNIFPGEVIYLSDRKIGQIYEYEKNRPYYVLKNFTSNNKIVILQITSKKHKKGKQQKIKINGKISYVIIDEPLTFKKEEIYNARSELTKINDFTVNLKRMEKYFIKHKFRKAFK
ncbi:MAG: hypothetical protein HPAVJP_1570 [Candidatus Hepatoplasma vulgare]|nr:MAG: hypothetical protein HPAVJP_1570 [Candidatus Hepatoplasma sp.]